VVEKVNRKKLIIDVLALLTLITVVVYITVKTLLFFFEGYTLIEKIIAVLIICGELLVLMHGFGYAFNILGAMRRKKEEFVHKMPAVEPDVAILVTARHKPRKILRDAIASIKNINYKNKSIYFLDDSSEAKYKKEAEGLAMLRSMV